MVAGVGFEPHDLLANKAHQTSYQAAPSCDIERWVYCYRLAHTNSLVLSMHSTIICASTLKKLKYFLNIIIYLTYSNFLLRF